MLYKTENLSSVISGVILHWETLFQKDADGKQMVDLITGQLSIAEEEFRCPVCLQIPRQVPIPCCPRGHIVCSNCLPNLPNNSCPTCRTRMRGNVSSAVGSYVMRMDHPCKFSLSGCPIKQNLWSIFQHEEKCLF